MGWVIVKGGGLWKQSFQVQPPWGAGGESDQNGVTLGEQYVLNVIGSYGLNNSSEYPAYLELLGVVLEGAPPDVIVLLRDINAHLHNDSETCKGIRMNGQIELNPSGVQLLLLYVANWSLPQWCDGTGGGREC